MLEKLLNKLGLYTERQAYNITLEAIRKLRVDFVRENERLKKEIENLIKSLKASEEAKAEATQRAIKLAKEHVTDEDFEEVK
ncbi:hypothetical protein JCM11957_06980 [Caminibacter profundus]